MVRGGKGPRKKGKQDGRMEEGKRRKGRGVKMTTREGGEEQEVEEAEKEILVRKERTSEDTCKK